MNTKNIGNALTTMRFIEFDYNNTLELILAPLHGKIFLIFHP